MAELEVLICTIGEAGIRRVLAARHPVVEGVSYLVAWQQPDTDMPVPPELAARPDFRVLSHKSRGISRNRNFALHHATAPFCLMADDDIDYDAAALSALIEGFKAYPEADIITLRYEGGESEEKVYPPQACRVKDAPRGYYVGAIEIALRRERVYPRVSFNEKVSIGTPVLRCGEEDFFMIEARRRGLRALFLPITIGRHDHPTTTGRDSGEDYFIMTQGAVQAYAHPLTWPLRVFAHALRRRAVIPPLRYLRLAIAGIRYARRNGIYR